MVIVCDSHPRVLRRTSVATQDGTNDKHRNLGSSLCQWLADLTYGTERRARRTDVKGGVEAAF